MPAREVKNRWLADFYFLGKRYRLKSPENSKKGAIAYERLIINKLMEGNGLIKQPKEKIMPTFLDFSQKWLDCYVKTNNKLSEQMHKKSVFNAHLNPFFGKLPLSEITNQKIEEFKAEKMKSGLKAKTINNIIAILAKCLATAEEWGVIEKTPKTKRLKVPPSEYDFLTKEEEDALITSADGVWREMIIVAVDAGLRLGEISALNWSAVDFEKNEITVKESFTVKKISAPKSNKKRHIPMTDRVYQTLFARKEKTGYIFTIDRGQPLLQNRCLNNLHKICQEAGIRQIKWHTLRHTFASRLISKGASVKAVQELLGHSDIKTTMRYAHLEKNVLSETIKILDGLSTFGHSMGIGIKDKKETSVIGC